MDSVILSQKAVSFLSRFPTYWRTDFLSTQRQISEEPHTQLYRCENLKIGCSYEFIKSNHSLMLHFIAREMDCLDYISLLQ